ncbi:MAG: hypothetical protein Q7J25_12300 [Vicinamibacterales bacterium]|nr:hypothetical protein [Vicinamibacterales bacterium]
MVEPLTQPELFEPVHASFHEDRLRHGIPERIYAEHWKSLNVRSPGVNHGYTYLEWILTPSGRAPGPVSQRDASVAAAVIQWLGTNCGMAFLQSAERAIEQALAAEHVSRRTVFPLVFYRPAPKTRRIDLEDL